MDPKITAMVDHCPFPSARRAKPPRKDIVGPSQGMPYFANSILDLLISGFPEGLPLVGLVDLLQEDLQVCRFHHVVKGP